MRRVAVVWISLLLTLASVDQGFAAAGDDLPKRGPVMACVHRIVSMGARAIARIPSLWRRREPVVVAPERPRVVVDERSDYERSYALLHAAKEWGARGSALATPSVPGAPAESLKAFNGFRDGYLELEALTAAREKIVSTDDLVGLALLIGERETSLFARGGFDRARWSTSTTPSIGLRMREPELFSGFLPTVAPTFTMAARYTYSSTEPGNFEVYRRTIAEHVRDMRSVGMVTVFGSGGEDARVNALAEDVGTTLGNAKYAVFSGGAGGSMAAANRAAKKTGAASIGIRVGGTAGPEREQLPSQQNHTLTLDVSAYTTRIPLLLLPPVIVFVPGTQGTTRELAAAILSVRRRNIDVFFLGEGYWGDVFRALEPLAKRENIPGRFHLVESGAEILATLKTKDGAAP